MLTLQVKGIGAAAIATTVVGMIQCLEGGNGCTVQVPSPHVAAMLQEKRLLEQVDHQIFFPKQFFRSCLVVHRSPLPV